MIHWKHSQSGRHKREKKRLDKLVEEYGGEEIPKPIVVCWVCGKKTRGCIIDGQYYRAHAKCMKKARERK